MKRKRSALKLDPAALARRQLDGDRRRTAWMPRLLERKVVRMSASPLAFLRGAAPLYYELLKARPGLDVGGPGRGWLAGDLHVENFGAFRPQTGQASPDKAVFNLNDFDDAVQGPWRWDVLRLTTSLLLGGRESGADGRHALELARALLKSYATAAGGRAARAQPPGIVRDLVEQVAGRSNRALLDDRTQLHRGKRRFIREDRYFELPRPLLRQVPAALARYMRGLEESTRPAADHFEILDAAFRVAGTGSLGSLRIAVLTAGKGGTDGGWIFDLKEENAPSAAIMGVRAGGDQALRVVTGMRACLGHPLKMAGTSRLGGRSMLVRRLTPQEDKLDLAQLHPSEWRDLALFLGATAGIAHRRGAAFLPSRAWSPAEQEQVLDSAVELAGLHESIYLEYCRQTS